MKKGVVLLITLFFITAISILVLKNLDDTDTFLEKQNYQLNNTQILIAIKNMQKELSRLLLENQDYVDKVLGDDILKTPTPISIEDLNIDFTIKKYGRTDVNKLQEKDSKDVQNLFSNNDVFDYEEFTYIYKEKLPSSDRKIETTKQLDDIINTFILRTENKNIDRIRDQLGFISDENLYEVNITASYIGLDANAFYLLKNDGKVLYFDISFN